MNNRSGCRLTFKFWPYIVSKSGRSGNRSDHTPKTCLLAARLSTSIGLRIEDYGWANLFQLYWIISWYFAILSPIKPHLDVFRDIHWMQIIEIYRIVSVSTSESASERVLYIKFYKFLVNFSRVFDSFSGVEGGCIGYFRSKRCSLHSVFRTLLGEKLIWVGECIESNPLTKYSNRDQGYAAYILMQLEMFELVSIFILLLSLIVWGTDTQSKG